MKNGDIIELYETLDRISKNKDLRFNVKVGFAMAKNKEKLRQEAAIIYNERRKIIMEHGEIRNGEIIVPKEFIDETNQKINDLMEIENNVEIIKLYIEDFEKYEMNMKDLEGLMLMIQPFEFTGSSV